MRPKYCRNNGLARLLGSCIALAVVWLVVLPWWGNRPAVRQRLEQLSQRGIDPSAMYYSELEFMPEVYARSAAALRKYPRAFFLPGAAPLPGDGSGLEQEDRCSPSKESCR